MEKMTFVKMLSLSMMSIAIQVFSQVHNLPIVLPLIQKPYVCLVKLASGIVLPLMMKLALSMYQVVILISILVILAMT